jgi:FtsZ-binding cell division protein ZapB
MSDLSILFTITALAVGVGIIVLIFLPYLKKKDVDTEEVLGKVENGLHKDMVGVLVSGGKLLDILSIIERCAEIGVGQAEQLNISSQLTADQRKKSAEDYVYSVFDKLGIGVDDNVKAIISGAIESKVYELKSSEEKKSDLQTEVQVEILQLKTQNSQLRTERKKLQQENEELKKKIADYIQSTAEPAKNATDAVASAQPVQ